MFNKKNKNFETKYDFVRDTLWPYLKTTFLLLFIGCIVLFAKVNLSPYWSILPFGIALAVIIIIIIASKNPEKFNYKDKEDDVDGEF